MKQTLSLFLLQLFVLCAVAQSQTQTDWDKGWSWIIPSKTQKLEIEKVFGNPITKNKVSSFQTYVADFGKITVTYAKEKKLVKLCSRAVEAGTVLGMFISPRNLYRLSDLGFNLKTFKKDNTYSPRELSYFSESEGILIATEIIELEDETKIERVFALEYKPVAGQCSNTSNNKRVRRRPNANSAAARERGKWVADNTGQL